MPSGAPSSGPPSPGGDAGVGGAGHLQRLVRRLQHIGVERARGGDGVQMRAGDLLRRERAGAQAVDGGGQGQACEVVHYSITLGTTK